MNRAAIRRQQGRCQVMYPFQNLIDMSVCSLKTSIPGLALWCSGLPNTKWPKSDTDRILFKLTAVALT